MVDAELENLKRRVSCATVVFFASIAVDMTFGDEATTIGGFVLGELAKGFRRMTFPIAEQYLHVRVAVARIHLYHRLIHNTFIDLDDQMGLSSPTPENQILVIRVAVGNFLYHLIRWRGRDIVF